MPNCLIGLGSNLGSRHEILEAAVRRLQGDPRIEIVGKSSWHTFPAIGGPSGQKDFLNGVLRLDTSLTPHELAEVLQSVECSLGRERSERWTARTLDCDLLLYGAQQINTPTLQIPHPRMMTRRFVLEPAAEIAAEMTHPSIGWSLGRLFEHLKSAPAYFAVTGSETAIVDRLARDLVARVNGRFIDGRSILPSRSSRSAWHRQLEFARRRSWLLRKNGLDAKIDILPDESPRISNFWLWQSLLSADASPVTQFDRHAKELQWTNRAMTPKLLIVTDLETSEFGQALAAFEPELCVPTLHLSADSGDAIQDAVGAVLSMR